ncbi:putative metal-binding motif-containing protein, partial [Nanoarchaeota archaeon]
LVDEDLIQECGESRAGICTFGQESCIAGSFQGCTAIMPQTEECNGIDDDCDGDLDEGCSCDVGTAQQCGTTDVGLCQYGLQQCVAGSWGVCEGSVEPRGEGCGDNLDNDCDGEVDEDCEFPDPTTQEVQGQPVENGEPAQTSQKIEEAEPIVATRPCIDLDGDGRGDNCRAGQDCDDQDADKFYGGIELCDGKDNDCNGRVDDQLTKVCGTNVGSCREGKEMCKNGVWMGCNAKFPEEERCNYVDDNCDGEVDEGCPEGDEDELLLKTFFDAEFGEEYDIDDVLEAYRLTKDAFTVEKSSVVKDGKTELKLVVKVLKPMTDVTIYEWIPKTVAQKAEDIEFEIEPKVIVEDPLIAWHFKELQGEKELKYRVKGEKKDVHKETKTVALSYNPDKTPWYYILLPVLIIPVVGFMFVILLQLSRKKK